MVWRRSIPARRTGSGRLKPLFGAFPVRAALSPQPGCRGRRRPRRKPAGTSRSPRPLPPLYGAGRRRSATRALSMVPRAGCGGCCWAAAWAAAGRPPPAPPAPPAPPQSPPTAAALAPRGECGPSPPGRGESGVTPCPQGAAWGVWG